MSNVHYIGADVAKDSIQLHFDSIKLPKQITNDATGLAALLKACKGQSVHLICEAPAPTPPLSPTAQALAAWSARRSQLLTMRVQERNRRQVPGLP